MLKRAFTAVVERNVELDTQLLTEPYETAWASQARWFVNVLSADAAQSISIAAEISPDGLTWCRHEAAPVHHRGVGLVSLPLDHPGPWQRLVLTSDAAAPAKVIVYLCLKE